MPRLSQRANNRQRRRERERWRRRNNVLNDNNENNDNFNNLNNIHNFQVVINPIPIQDVADILHNVRQGIAPFQPNIDQDYQRLNDSRRFPLRNRARHNMINPFPRINDIGRLDQECNECLSLSFQRENFPCCNHGNIALPEAPEYPHELLQLFLGNDAHSRNFRRYIRTFNNMFAFASLEVNIQPPPGRDRGRIFRVCGLATHRTLPLHPNQPYHPRLNQIYIYHGAEAVNQRIANPMTDRRLNRHVITIIQNAIDDNHPYANAYRHMFEIEQEELARAQQDGRPPPSITMTFRENYRNPRRYNRPRFNEIAAIFNDDEGRPPLMQVIVNSRQGGPRNLPRLSSLIDPLCYPLLFPHGQHGWSPNLPLQFPNDDRPNARRNISMLEFYVFLLRRTRNPNPITVAGVLLQQYLVDIWLRVEHNNLNYLRQHQNDLRVHQYQGLLDHLERRHQNNNLNNHNHNNNPDNNPNLNPNNNPNNNVNNINPNNANNNLNLNNNNLNNNNPNDNNDNLEPLPGRPIILPSSHQGSPRAMQQRYQDAMAIVAKFGNPDIFLTFTTNPCWSEIQQNLSVGQDYKDVPDLISRVFHMKQRSLMENIWQKGILGKVLYFVWVIEFQKRMLPHMHLLFKFYNDDRPRDEADVDNLITAEIPDPDEDPDLFEFVSKNLLHGPCGAMDMNSPCMVNGACSKNFPKEFKEHTEFNVGAYPKYRRPNNGRTVPRRSTTGQLFYLDNRWVVPFNKTLIRHYRSHINVELCNGLTSVKYLYKYIYKGHDRADIVINQQYEHDEIKEYVNARYVSACEASYRLFKFDMVKTSHHITRLAVHLPNFQNVIFAVGQEDQALQRARDNQTQLTAFFLLNQVDPTARAFLYGDIIHLYRWCNQTKSWIRRARRLFGLVTRMYSVSPRERERFSLRSLLNHVRGPQSFEDLKTVNGIVYDTFQQACVALGLAQDDNLWINTLTAAIVHRMPRALRSMFAHILLFGEIADPLNLWNRFRNHLFEDFTRRGMSEDAAQNSALNHIAAILRSQGQTLQDHNLPAAQDVPNNINQVDVIAAQRELDQMQPLNCDQQAFAETVIASVHEYIDGNHDQARLFYLDGPAGTGKTYTYNFIVNTVNLMNHQVATSAYTGCAANLLRHGKTCHSLFKLPFVLNEDSVCGIDRASPEAQFLLSILIFIIDEAPMKPRFALEAIDRLFRFLTGNHDVPFGGKIFILGGDHMQTLPIVPRALNIAVRDYTIFSSQLWHLFHVFHLRVNNRVRPNEQQFANFLLSLGRNQLPRKQQPPFQGSITIPQQCILRNNIVSSIFPQGFHLNQHYNVILTPTNDVALKLNDQILRRVPGNLVECLSVDTIEGDQLEPDEHYPQEYLHSITPTGMPPHNLKLKRGCIVMLLRNIDTNNGLSNGTRLIVDRIELNIIHATILSGVFRNTQVFIPKLPLRPAEGNLPFFLKRLQFPLRLAYAVTINKAQGQTYDKVGIYLKKPCFAHGQLYVAFSRAKSFDDVKVFIEETQHQGHHRGNSYTENIVEPNIL